MSMTVCITGATAGIGLQTARQFKTIGARLLLLARREDRLSALKRELGAEIAVVDVSDGAAVKKALEGAEVDVLVNNAGMALGLDPVQSGRLDDWNRMVEVNINGVLNVTHALLPGMVARNKGHIINLGSLAATHAYPGANIYGATKAFLRQLTMNMKTDLLGTQVRVTTIDPGMVETEFSIVRFGGDEEKAKNVYKGTLPLTAEDVAETVVWCAMRPAHVNILSVEMMPTAQAFAGFSVYRQ